MVTEGELNYKLNISVFWTYLQEQSKYFFFTILSFFFNGKKYAPHTLLTSNGVL